MSHILIFNLYQNLLIGFYNLSFIFENTEAKKYWISNFRPYNYNAMKLKHNFQLFDLNLVTVIIVVWLKFCEADMSKYRAAKKASSCDLGLLRFMN